MRKIVINGGKALKGTVTVSGAKNSVVALIPAIILAEDVVVLDGVPAISDVDSLIDIMETMGATVKRDGETLEIDPRGVQDMPMPYGKINSLRASYYFYGSLLGRYGKAVVGLPGGCDLGPRPIDLHLKAFAVRKENDRSPRLFCKPQKAYNLFCLQAGHCCPLDSNILGHHVYRAPFYQAIAGNDAGTLKQCLGLHKGTAVVQRGDPLPGCLLVLRALLRCFVFITL